MSFLLLFSAQVAWAQTTHRSDTLEVLYRVGQSDIDLSYADNARRIDGFTERVRQRYASVPADQLKLDLYTGASPEGPSELNRRLGEQRGISLRNVLVEKLGARVANITIFNQGARWGGLYNLIKDSDEPWKDDVIKILAKTPGENEYDMDPREQELRRLNGGRVWVQLQNKYLSKLRSSGMAIVAEIPEPVHRVDTLVILDTIIYMPEACPVYEPPVFYSRNPAIKTNLLFWAVGAPNIQVEFPLGKKNRWSIEGEFAMPWITWNKNAHAEQGVNVGFEVRYWLGNRMKHHTLDGWHIGLAAESGYYDVEWKKHEGYQGEFSNTYLNLGWQKRFGKMRRWGFDASVGLGWFHTKYRHYLGSSIYPVGHEETQDYHLMWQDDLNKHERYSQYRNFFGATHANIGFSYFLGKQKFRTRYVTPAEIEAEIQLSREVKAQKQAIKEAAKAERNNAKQAEAEAREQAKAEKRAMKLAADQNKDAEKAAKNAEKDAEKAAKEAAKAAEKEAKEAAKAAEKEAKEAEKAAEQEAKAAAKAAKAAAKEAGENIDKDAEKAAKEAAKAAEKEAKAQAKAAEEAAKAAEKEAAEQAKAQAKAAKEAEKAAEKEAKEATKAAKAAAKNAGEEVSKDAEKAAKEAEKAAEKEAKEAAKAAEKAAKEAEKAAAAQAKEAEKAAKEAEKAAAAQAKEAEKAAKEAAKAAEAQAKEQANALKEAEKAAAAQAKEAEKAAKEQAKAAAAAAKEAEKAAAAEAKAAAAAAKEAEKAAAAQAKEAEKAAKEQAKAAEKAAKEAEKAAAAEAKAAEKAAKEEAKAAAKAAKEAAKAEKSNAK